MPSTFLIQNQVHSCRATKVFYQYRLWEHIEFILLVCGKELQFMAFHFHSWWPQLPCAVGHFEQVSSLGHQEARFHMPTRRIVNRIWCLGLKSAWMIYHLSLTKSLAEWWLTDYDRAIRDYSDDELENRRHLLFCGWDNHQSSRTLVIDGKLLRVGR